MSEDELQQRCYQWFWNTYQDTKGVLYHVPNGGKRKAREANKLKFMGVKAGMPDFNFDDHRGGFYLEMKTTAKGSRLSPTQKKLFPTLSKVRNVYLVRTFEDFQELFVRYFKQPTYDEVFAVLDGFAFIKPRAKEEMGFHEIEIGGEVVTYPTKALYEYADKTIQRGFLRDAMAQTDELCDNVFSKKYQSIKEYEWDYKKPSGMGRTK